MKVRSELNVVSWLSPEIRLSVLVSPFPQNKAFYLIFHDSLIETAILASSYFLGTIQSSGKDL